MATAASLNHLLLALDSRRLYLLSDEDLQDTVVTSGIPQSDSQYIEVVELKSFLFLSMRRDALERNLVPDLRVFQELRSLEITGLQPTVSLRAEPASLPLAGNLNNPSWLSICLSGHCDSDCVFCFTNFIRNDQGLEFQEVMKVLKCGREMMIQSVVFSGGEPTLSRNLAVFVKTARHLGYARIGIQTNGHRIASEKYLSGLIEAGLSNALVSLHGSNAITHNRLTRTASSFERASRGLTNLCKAQICTTINFVVCRDNGPLAAQMVEFVAQYYRGAALRFSFLIVEGAASNCVRNQLPTIPEFIEWVGRALKRADELSVLVEVENVPPCVSSVLGTSGRYLLSLRQSLVQASPFYKAIRYRGELGVKLAACDECAMNGSCSGLQMAYLANVSTGAEHLYPIKRQH